MELLGRDSTLARLQRLRDYLQAEVAAMRLPPGDCLALKASEQGAELYVKTGHLQAV